MPFLEAQNLHKTYRLGRHNKIHVLRGISLSIDSGEMVAIMGPSGCGKTTLMHMLGLLQPPDPDSSPPPRLIIGDRDAATLRDRERTRMRAQSMGFVFQTFNLVTTLTAVENVSLAAEYAGSSRSKAMAAGRNALDWVSLADRAGHRPNELSGGEQQRVAIARALVNEPDLLLADEPTGNLDSGSTTEVLALLRRFHEERGQTIVLVTHDSEVGAACDRVLSMLDGEILRDDARPSSRAVRGPDRPVE